MKTVITYGTFDLFHIGHLRLLQRAKQLGDRLIVAVSTDEFNRKKGKEAIIPFEQRAEIVANIKCVDMVIPEESWEQKIEDIKKYNVNVLVMGDDWLGKFDYLKEYCDVVYLPRTEGISSTQIRNTLSNISEDYIRIFERIAHELKQIDFEAVEKALRLLIQIKKDLR